MFMCVENSDFQVLYLKRYKTFKFQIQDQGSINMNLISEKKNGFGEPDIATMQVLQKHC